jgi:hypothetical protein
MTESTFQRRQTKGNQSISVRQSNAVLQDGRTSFQPGKLSDDRLAQRVQKLSNTGVSNPLKHSVASASGMTMNDVRGDNSSDEFALLAGADSQDERLPFGGGPAIQMVQSVNNLVGTSHLKPRRKGINSWRAHHIHHAKVAWHKCSVKGCRRMATVGAHVRETGSPANTTSRYIVPFCQFHNKRPHLLPLRLKKGTRLVGVGKGHVVSSD